jgi:DeoR/GlpR family transcriptional regulator of sugar metabolism
MENDYMFQVERQKKILDYVNKAKKASVNELSDFLGVSKVTIRRYLNELESKGLVIKIHGGVLSVDSDLNYEIPYSSKKDLNIAEKVKIGIAASKLIEDGDVVVLDAGSTTLEIAQHIENKKVTIITNDVKIAFELAPRPNVNLIITGGTVQKNVYTIIGSNTENFLSKVHVNKAFLGADAINIEYGVTNRTLEEVAIKKAMIKAAEQIILVADHSKLNKKAFSDVCRIDEIDTIVIDKIDDNYKKIFSEKGINIIIA